jgi:excisionase family DNA binding protein
MDDDARVVFTVEEVAALLGVARSTMYALVRDGAVPCVRRGRRQWTTRPVVESLIGFPPPRPSQVARQVAAIADATPPSPGDAAIVLVPSSPSVGHRSAAPVDRQAPESEQPPLFGSERDR